VTLTDIVIFIVGALLYMTLVPARLRGWALLVASVVAIYALQPLLPVRRLDFILPTTTLVLTITGWLFTKPDKTFSRDDGMTLAMTAVLIVALSFTRYLAPEMRLTSQPPEPLHVALGLTLALVLVYGLWRGLFGRNILFTGMILLIVVLFAIIKADPLTVQIAGMMRSATGQDVTLASTIDIAGWLGFSYVAFRLLHTLRDRQSGKLPELTLREYLTYVIFFPAYTAGPIDRAERFVIDYRALPQLTGLDPQRIVEGGGRITIGLLKKFAIADSLATIALNPTTAAQAQSPLALWMMLYAFAFQLYLDFSGYTDIAIGVGMLFGVKLPENFDRPYLKNNITAFWQSWHITLSSWARFYVFTPLSRSLLSRKPKPPTWAIILTAHVATMLVIGLWHDFTMAFVMWGLWHALGLFVHKQWSDRTRFWYIGLKERSRALRLWYWVGVFITFHFVVLSWIWFALPDFETGLRVFLGLFGL
jgi:alginate O-acetyltransferase complex protein AlgI